MELESLSLVQSTESEFPYVAIKFVGGREVKGYVLPASLGPLLPAPALAVPGGDPTTDLATGEPLSDPP